MKNYSYRLEEHIDNKIKVGDVVKLTDGSALTLKKAQVGDKGEFHIVHSYPLFTGKEEILKDIECMVVETGVEDYVCMGVLDIVRIQDIVVQCGNAKFRTCSKFVKKLSEEEIRENEIERLWRKLKEDMRKYQENIVTPYDNANNPCSVCPNQRTFGACHCTLPYLNQFPTNPYTINY